MNASIFLTQLLPLLVFVVVDAFVTDVRVSIACAILFAFGQLAVTWAKTRRFDWFVVVDVALIATLGGVSIALENDLFFKVKPAIIEGVTIVFMGVLILAPDRLLTGYFARMAPGMAQQPAALGAMKASLGWMCGYLALHIGAVLYTALLSSREIWAFVSGPGFYVGLLPLGAFVLGRALLERRKAKGGPPPASPEAPGPASARTRAGDRTTCATR